MPLYSSQQSYDLFVNGDLIFEKNIKLSEEAYDLLKNTITIENKRLDLDKIFEHPFFKKGKGLSIEKFPDYNNKDYMTKIAKLTSEFQIKPMIRITIKNVKKSRKKRKKEKIHHLTQTPPPIHHHLIMKIQMNHLILQKIVE